MEKEHPSFLVKIILTAPVQPEMEYNIIRKEENEIKVSIDPPTKTKEKTFTVKINVRLGKLVNKKMLWVASICYFEIISDHEELLMDLRSSHLIEHLTHMTKSTYDQTRAYFQMAAANSPDKDFRSKIIIEKYYNVDTLRPIVAASIITDVN